MLTTSPCLGFLQWVNSVIDFPDPWGAVGEKRLELPGTWAQKVDLNFATLQLRAQWNSVSCATGINRIIKLVYYPGRKQSRSHTWTWKCSQACFEFWGSKTWEWQISMSTCCSRNTSGYLLVVWDFFVFASYIIALIQSELSRWYICTTLL